MKISVITPTHNATWFDDTCLALRDQTYDRWEWIISVNHEEGRARELAELRQRIEERTSESSRDSKRIQIFTDENPDKSIGQRKSFAFSGAEGTVVLELDHDDILVPTALEEVANAFEDPEVDFVYSDWADFENQAHSMPQGEPTYRNPEVRAGWETNNFQFYNQEIKIPAIHPARSGNFECVRSFAPSAAAFSSIYWSPNHLRAWRRSFYDQIGGHDPSYQICDDHELLCRTYLHARKIQHIEKPLYLYRVTGENTWASRVDEIKAKTTEIGESYIERLALKQASLAHKLALDLGGVHGTPGHPWTPVDADLRIESMGGIKADLTEPWPFEDNSIGVIRAHDFLEHLPDKAHTMKEIYRVLMPGGILLSLTPSTDGRGAFMDPGHVSYWNENTFWYWTRKEQAKYLPADVAGPRFQELTLKTFFPTDWHKTHHISYVRAVLVALKDGYDGPGEKLI